jgi:hypothetical protein
MLLPAAPLLLLVALNVLRPLLLGCSMFEILHMGHAERTAGVSRLATSRPAAPTLDSVDHCKAHTRAPT